MHPSAGRINSPRCRCHVLWSPACRAQAVAAWFLLEWDTLIGAVIVDLLNILLTWQGWQPIPLGKTWEPLGTNDPWIWNPLISLIWKILPSSSRWFLKLFCYLYDGPRNPLVCKDQSPRASNAPVRSAPNCQASGHLTTQT